MYKYPSSLRSSEWSFTDIDYCFLVIDSEKEPTNLLIQGPPTLEHRIHNRDRDGWTIQLYGPNRNPHRTATRLPNIWNTHSYRLHYPLLIRPSRTTPSLHRSMVHRLHDRPTAITNSEPSTTDTKTPRSTNRPDETVGIRQWQTDCLNQPMDYPDIHRKKTYRLTNLLNK